MSAAVDSAAVARGKSTFYYAMRLMPAERRAAMFAIYDIARAVDDIADEPGDLNARRAAMAAWREEIAALYAGAPTYPLTRGLLPSLRQFDIPRAEFLQLILGMEMDLEGPIRAPTLPVLDLYCRRVAGAVGLLSLPVFGADGPAEHEFALLLGRALQLTNILRDVAEDAAIGRLYLPRDYLHEAGIDSDDPNTVVSHPRLADAMRRLALDAEQSFAAADETLARCRRRPLWPALAMMAAYRPVLARLAEHRYSPHIRIRPSKKAALWAAFRAAFVPF
jgi:squalene synthase HpnD